MRSRIGSFFRNLLRKGAVEQALDDELQSAVELLTQEKMKKWLSHPEARRQALIELGGVEQIKEEVRAIRPGMFLETFAQDLRYSVRILRKSPGFTTVAVLTLALGIGAATTIFSVIDNVLLEPFPYVDAQRIVMITIHNDADNRPGGRSFFRDDEFLDYEEQNHVFDAVIGGTGQDILYFNGEGTEQFDGGYVTANMFQVLGVPALLGRTLMPDDDKPGAPPVFLMAYKLWAGRFSLDPKIVGSTFTLNGVPTTLVGIMPPRVTKLGDAWRHDSYERRGHAVKGEGATYDLGIKTETSRPQLVCHEKNRRSPWLVVIGRQCPAQERGNSEYLEHVCSYISAVELLGALAVEVENVLTCSANHRVEDMVLFLIIQKFIIAKE